MKPHEIENSEFYKEWLPKLEILERLGPSLSIRRTELPYGHHPILIDEVHWQILAQSYSKLKEPAREWGIRKLAERIDASTKTLKRLESELILTQDYVRNLLILAKNMDSKPDLSHIFC